MSVSASDPLIQSWMMPASLRSRLQAAGPAVAFPRALAVDPTTGLVRVDGRGRSIVLDGDAAYEQWVSLTLRNHRDAHPRLPRWYGVHKALILAQPTPDEQRAAFEREVRRTLLPPADPRTGTVGFEWGAQAGRMQPCTVTVVSVRGLESRVAVEVPVG